MFITFEGIEGSGKSTALHNMAKVLINKKFSVLCTLEPGGCILGQKLRNILLDSQTKITTQAELYLFLADRAQHVSEILRPALLAGKTVLCDRYTDSTLAYQGFARHLDLPELITANDLATGGLRPDLTFVFDLPVEEGLKRAIQRDKDNGTIETQGRFDSESIAFHSAVREGFLGIAARAPDRVQIIDAMAPEETVLNACLTVWEQRVKQSNELRPIAAPPHYSFVH